jgi:putative spermidine/putrescine transport system permease protein
MIESTQDFGRKPSEASAPSGPTTLGLKMNRWAILTLPGVLVLIIIFVLPLAQLSSSSFYRNAGLGQVAPGFTLQNYADFLSDPFYLGVLLQTFQLGFAVTFCCALISYPMAYYMARMSGRFQSLLLFVLVAPLLVSVVIRNLGWIPILAEHGLVNWILLSLGVIETPIRLLNNFAGVLIGMVHACAPFMMLSLLAVIQGIEPEIEEASINLGAGPIETFWRVVFPLSRPGLLAGSLLVFTMTISAYTTPAVMGGRRVLVMSTFIEQQMGALLNYAFGSTAAVILMVVTVALTLIATYLGGRDKHHA